MDLASKCAATRSKKGGAHMCKKTKTWRILSVGSRSVAYKLAKHLICVGIAYSIAYEWDTAHKVIEIHRFKTLTTQKEDEDLMTYIDNV
jgi:hypothetical protein